MTNLKTLWISAASALKFPIEIVIPTSKSQYDREK